MLTFLYWIAHLCDWHNDNCLLPWHKFKWCGVEPDAIFVIHSCGKNLPKTKLMVSSLKFSKDFLKFVKNFKKLTSRSRKVFQVL